MNITVILCTYNRCRMLAKALQSAAELQLPAVQWEVLVVDNNSRDDTAAVVKQFSARYPGRFRYLFEPRPGKSHALNAGIREADGDILAFMDDDVTVEPTWLENLTKSMREGDYVGAGGRILPEWGSEPPAWLTLEGPYALAPLAVFDLGTDPGPLTEPPFGTNMAFRKRMFERYGGFRTDLGPHPSSQIRSEDTEFGRRVLDGGERLWYEPAAIVYHPVPGERLRKAYFLAWWFDKGRAEVREFGLPATRFRVGGIPLYLFRHAAVRLLLWSVATDRKHRFQRKAEVWQKAGQIIESRRRASKGDPPAAQPSNETIAHPRT